MLAFYRVDRGGVQILLELFSLSIKRWIIYEEMPLAKPIWENFINDPVRRERKTSTSIYHLALL